MASPREIRAGKAFVELGVKDHLQAGLNAARKRLMAFGAGLASVGLRFVAAGAAGLAAFGAAGKYFASAGDSLDKMSQRVGASVEFLSALGYAARLGGTDIEAMEVGIRRLQRTAYDAAAGSKTAADAFAALGINVKGADGSLKSTESLFTESAAALSKLTNNTQKAALATVIFGRAGTSLLPMLRDGAGGLEAAMQEAKRLGLVMSQQDAQAAAALTDDMFRLTSVLKMGLFRVGAAVAPVLRDVAQRITEVSATATEWLSRNAGLVVSVAKLTAVALAAGLGMVALGKAVSLAGTALGILGVAVSAASSLFAAMLTPIGLVATAAAALGTYVFIASGNAVKALTWLGKTWGELRAVAVDVLAGIRDALAAGDLGLAAKIAWAGMKLAWLEGTQDVRKVTGEWWQSLCDVVTNIWYDTQRGLAGAWAVMQSTWVNTVAFMSTHFPNFTAGIRIGWEAVQDYFTTRLLALKWLFDDTFDLKAALEGAASTHKAFLETIEKDRKKSAADIEADRKKDLEAIDAQERASLSEINQASEAARKAHAETYAADLKAAKDALAAALQELAELKKQAKDARAFVETPPPGQTPLPRRP